MLNQVQLAIISHKLKQPSPEEVQPYYLPPSKPSRQSFFSESSQHSPFKESLRFLSKQKKNNSPASGLNCTVFNKNVLSSFSRPEHSLTTKLLEVHKPSSKVQAALPLPSEPPQRLKTPYFSTKGHKEELLSAKKKPSTTDVPQRKHRKKYLEDFKPRILKSSS